MNSVFKCVAILLIMVLCLACDASSNTQSPSVTADQGVINTPTSQISNSAIQTGIPTATVMPDVITDPIPRDDHELDIDFATQSNLRPFTSGENLADCCSFTHKSGGEKYDVIIVFDMGNTIAGEKVQYSTLFHVAAFTTMKELYTLDGNKTVDQTSGSSVEDVTIKGRRTFYDVYGNPDVRVGATAIMKRSVATKIQWQTVKISGFLSLLDRLDVDPHIDDPLS